jgi:hypothetical protein
MQLENTQLSFGFAESAISIPMTIGTGWWTKGENNGEITKVW